MRPMKRAIHFDFHTLPGIYDFNRDWDAGRYAQRLADANVTYINMFAQCNLGYAYYPTRIGIPYPGMKGDMFGDLLRECRKRDIGVSAYINVGLNHEQALRHPEWLRLDNEGRILRGNRDGSFFRTMCYNNPGYRKYLLDTIREILAYEPDGLFCDCMQVFPCHCTQCTQDMLARGIDINDESAVTAFGWEVMHSICDEIRSLVPEGTYLQVNGMPYYEFRNVYDHIEIECLPTGAWGYDTFWKQAAYARNIQKEVVYMTGRFQASWGDFGGYRPIPSIESDLYDALCNACHYSIGDHMHPAEIEERDIYRDIGKMYARLMPYEHWTEQAKYLPEIGILTDGPGYTGSSLVGAPPMIGAARMLGELKYNFDIIHKDMDFSRFPLLILPDDLRTDDALCEKLADYAAKGGKILSSGFGGVKEDGSGFCLPQYDLVYDGEDPSNASYFTFRRLPDPDTADMRYSDYAEGIRMFAGAKADILADHWKPYFNKGWDGMHGRRYTPPEKPTGHTAAAVCPGEDGSPAVAHIAFRVFTAYSEHFLQAHKLLVKQILEMLLPAKRILTEGFPSTSRVTATGCDAYTLVHCKVTYPELRNKMGIVEEHTVQPEGSKVSLRGKYAGACLLPDETPLKTEYADGYTTVTLPRFAGYTLIRFNHNLT